MNIVVLDGFTLNPGDNPWDDIAALGKLEVHARTPDAEIVKRAAEADIALTNKTLLTRETLERLPRLKFISVLATGYNAVDIQAAREKGIPVSNVPTYGTDSVAQHTIGLLLELCHRVGQHDQSVKEKEWSRCLDFCYWKSPLVELVGKTLGIVGYGRIGQRVAEIARAFGMNIIYHDRYDNPNARRVSLEELALEADVISLHCALTSENAGFVNQAFLSKVKPTTFLVNTSRGPLINEADLADALEKGKLAGAALDVLSVEPPAPEHPLYRAPNCILTPHMAWTGLQARRNLMNTTTANIRAFLSGTPINVVNA